MLSQAQYVSIAAFRHQLRRFLSFSEAAANAAGLPAQQHQALLAIAGHSGSAPPTVGTLADQLLIAPHTAAELVSRMAEADLITKTPSPTDRRRLHLTLTLKAAGLLAELTREHLTELDNLRTLLEDVAAKITVSAGPPDRDE